MSEIPPSFHSLEHDEPFQKCLACEKRFDELSDPYKITKVFKGTECVFEYAMCLPCQQELAQSFSEESRQTMMNFFEQNPHISKRSEKLGESQDHKEWTRRCATCDTALAEVNDYSIACMGFGNHMVYDPFPMMVCSQCERDLQSKLSKSTRDSWDKFILDNFEGPPADALKPDGVPMLV